MELEQLGKQARSAARKLAIAPTELKNRWLQQLISELESRQAAVLEANRADIAQAKEAGLTPAMIDRLSLQNQLPAIVADLKKVIALPDPVGERFESSMLRNGLKIEKRRTAIGVIGVIYESRPNVTIDVAALGLKSGNVVILRGGKESLQTNRVLTDLIQKALFKVGLPKEAVISLYDPDRKLMHELLRLDRYIDLIIPRGGAALHTLCRQQSTIPVITGGIGICHLFVDASADLNKMVGVVLNAKTQRPTVCNALDTLLLHEKIAEEALHRLLGPLQKSGVTLHLDPKSWERAGEKRGSHCVVAAEGDFDIEWLSLHLSVAVVKNLDGALDHIAEHSSGHSESILTEEMRSKERFLAEVDAAAVYVNASTRFTDGAQFGLGAEVAISTQKLHARGPMGLKELTSYKWVIEGNYTSRE